MRKHFLCAACGSKMTYHGSRLENKLLRRTYAQCTNDQCQARWIIYTEIAQCLSPPLAPYKSPLPTAKRQTSA